MPAFFALRLRNVTDSDIVLTKPLADVFLGFLRIVADEHPELHTSGLLHYTGFPG
jgi:hypothetical protein